MAKDVVGANDFRREEAVLPKDVEQPPEAVRILERPVGYGLEEKGGKRMEEEGGKGRRWRNGRGRKRREGERVARKKERKTEER